MPLTCASNFSLSFILHANKTIKQSLAILDLGTSVAFDDNICYLEALTNTAYEAHGPRYKVVNRRIGHLLFSGHFGLYCLLAEIIVINTVLRVAKMKD